MTLTDVFSSSAQEADTQPGKSESGSPAVIAGFADLVFGPRRRLGGIQATMFWPNGYGVSVIKGYGSYGDEEGLYELAVGKGDADDWSLCYDTPVTDDVEGHLSEADVTRLMATVQSLPPAISRATSLSDKLSGGDQ